MIAIIQRVSEASVEGDTKLSAPSITDACLGRRAAGRRENRIQRMWKA